MVLKGHIDQYFETGCEGVMWYFWEDGKKWPELLHQPDNGDHLKIFGENGEVLFDGIIDRDTKIGIPKKSRRKQPCALGHWVHWTQKGWQPDEWAKLFFHQYLIGNEGKKPLRAELTKSKKQRG